VDCQLAQEAAAPPKIRPVHPLLKAGRSAPTTVFSRLSAPNQSRTDKALGVVRPNKCLLTGRRYSEQINSSTSSQTELRTTRLSRTFHTLATVALVLVDGAGRIDRFYD
jgi:hypothetical protein